MNDPVISVDGLKYGDVDTRFGGIDQPAIFGVLRHADDGAPSAVPLDFLADRITSGPVNDRQMPH